MNIKRALLVLIGVAAFAFIAMVILGHRSEVMKINGCEGTPGYQSDASYQGIQYVDRRTHPEITYYTNCEGKLVQTRWYDTDTGVRRELFEAIPGWNKDVQMFPLQLEDGPLWLVNEFSDITKERRTKFEDVKRYIDQKVGY